MQYKRQLLIGGVLFATIIIVGAYNTLGSNNYRGLFYYQKATSTPTPDGGIIDTPPPPPGATETPFPTSIPPIPTDTPTPEPNTVLGAIDEGDFCWLSTATRSTRINVRSDHSLYSDILGQLRTDRAYRVIDSYIINEDIWWRIEADITEPEINNGWVAGILNQYAYTIVRGRCNDLINLDVILDGCNIDMIQVRNLPPYIQFVYAYADRPCESFQRILRKMNNDRYFEDRIVNIERFLDQCPVLIPLLYRRAVLEGDIIDSDDFICYRSYPTSVPIQTSTPIPTSIPDVTPTVTQVGIRTRTDIAGIFLVRPEDDPTKSSLYKIDPEGHEQLEGTNDGQPKFYPILDADRSLVYYLSEKDGKTILWQYDINIHSAIPIFEDRENYKLVKAPFAVASDGSYLLVVLHDLNGTTIYKLNPFRVPADQDVSQPLLQGINDIVSVSISSENNLIAVVRMVGNSRIYVYDADDLTLTPYLIGNEDLRNMDCFAPSFASNEVWLYFACSDNSTNRIFIQQDISIDEQDEIQLQFSDSISELTSINRLSPISYQSLVISDNRSVYLVHFSEESPASLDYANGQFVSLLDNPDAWLVTDVAWAAPLDSESS